LGLRVAKLRLIVGLTAIDALRLGHGARDLAGGLHLDVVDDALHAGQVLFDASDNLVIDEVRIEASHPLVLQVLPQLFCVKRKLQKSVHFVGFLRGQDALEVRGLQLVQTEEGEVGQTRVEGHVVAVEPGALLVEDAVEDFQEFFVTDVPVKHLLYEDLLVRVLNLHQVTRINR